MKAYGHLWQYLSEFFLEREMFQTKCCGENQNTHFVFNTFFFSKIVPFMRKCEKNGKSQTRHRWQYNKAHAFGMLGN
jgi:hypothetical protein